MAYIDHDIGLRALGSYVGSSHECVSLVQAWAKVPGGTGTWHPGLHVLENETHIAKGTAIATFVDGHYPSDDRHAALFVSGSQQGIVVIDQWQGQVSHERTIHFGSHGRQNDPNAYYVID